MTIEQIVGATADELERLSDEQILEYFKPVLHLCRPTVERKEGGSQRDKKTVDRRKGKEIHYEQAKDLLQEFLKLHPELGAGDVRL